MVADRVNRVAPSATLGITARAKAMRAQGRDVVSLGAGEPDFDTPEHIKKALYEAVEEGFIYYTPSKGIQELRRAIAEKFKKDNSLGYDPEKEIMVTPGAKQALYEAILAVTNPGDEILIPSPFWVSYEPMVQLADGKPVFVPTHEEEGFRLAPEEVAREITNKTRGIIINSPNNPTGAVFRMGELREIAELCAAYDLVAISDEIYEKIIYDGEHVSIASLPGMKERTITINGFSKAYSMTGWRLGYAAAPEELITAMAKVQEHSVSCPTSFVQKAGVAALEGPQDEVDAMVKEFRKRRDVLVSGLNEIDEVSCVMPEGAFYVFANFSAYDNDSFKLAGELLERAGVAVIPGAAFGSQGEGYLRMSYATSMDNILEALERIKKALREMAHE